MLKKIIAWFMICAMLVSLSPVLATASAADTPSIEAILNNYHQKSFEAQQDADDTSSRSRSTSNQKTLEEETVDTLTAAGYEAYNVTASNYDELEAALQTDFAEMGLSEDCSYVVVVSGEDTSTSNSSGQRATGSSYDIVPAPDGSGASSFTYTYNGTTYTMRFILFTSTTGQYMVKTGSYALYADDDSLVMTILSDVSAYAVAALTSGVASTLISIATLLAGWMPTSDYVELGENGETLHAQTGWTCSAIQIWNSSQNRWVTAQCSAYAVTSAKIAGWVWDADANASVWTEGDATTFTTYSPLYMQYFERYDDAVEAYINGTKSYDHTGDIDFYFSTTAGVLLTGSDGSPLFSHLEEWIVPSYSTS